MALNDKMKNEDNKTLIPRRRNRYAKCMHSKNGSKNYFSRFHQKNFKHFGVDTYIPFKLEIIIAQNKKKIRQFINCKQNLLQLVTGYHKKFMGALNKFL